MSDGLISRYTRQLKAANVRETTRSADDDQTHHACLRPSPQGFGVLILRQGTEDEYVFEVRKSRTTIGRGHESDIVLHDSAVSRKHATVTRDEEGSYRIRDQDSVNGTYVNGQRIIEHVLDDGDEIQVGMMMLAFRQY